LTQANAQLRDVLVSLTKSHDQLKTTQMQLIEAEKMHTVGRLAAGVAHEVKNPLAVLQMGVGFLVNQIPADGAAAALVLKEMNEAVERADGVVSDLLEFAAPRELELQDTDLETLVRQSLRFVRHELNAAKVTPVTNFAGRLPSCRLDRNKIKQVLVNLFVNACHAMPAGGTLTIKTSCHQLVTDEEPQGGHRPAAQFRAGDVIFTVDIADTGKGIPAAQLSHVFDPYFTTKPTGKGNGLGLAVTKAIVDLHGGRICINNRNEGGVVVTLALRNRREHERT
jgi:signal transduction histidine kinase